MTENEKMSSGSGDEINSSADPGSLEPPATINLVQVKVEERFGVAGPPLAEGLVKAWNRLLGGGMEIVQFMTQWRAAGLRRPGVVAHLFWPRLNSRVALGIDPPLAHAVVDRLLGYERTAAESRLQISPVEWGILSFVVANGLQNLDDNPGPLGPWDLAIDHVGPDPFDLTDLGPVVTWRWWVRVGPITGSARLWVPESLVSHWLETEKATDCGFLDRSQRTANNWNSSTKKVSDWCVEAGRLTLDHVEESQSLSPGQIMLIDDAPLSGTIMVPTGNVSLSHTDFESRRWFPAKLETEHQRLKLRISGTIQQAEAQGNLPRIQGSGRLDSHDSIPNPGTIPNELHSSDRSESFNLAPTLIVELCRVSLSLEDIAELRLGDLVDLGRQGGDPVNLSLHGRIIAQGELVQIDTELVVRINRTIS